MRTSYERAIDVEASPDEAYACWSRLSDFPAFVGELERVDELTRGRSRWHARFAGIDYAWTAEITERIPGRRIAWCTREGPANAGCVTFNRLESGRTRVMLQLDYRPNGLIASAGDILRLPQLCLDAALEGFKRWVEGGPPRPAAPTPQARNAPAAPRPDYQPGL